MKDHLLYLLVKVFYVNIIRKRLKLIEIVTYFINPDILTLTYEEFHVRIRVFKYIYIYIYREYPIY